MLQDIIQNFALQQGYSPADLAAAQEAHARKWRLSHPIGSFDKAGRFTLKERCACCEGIRVASRAYPHSEMTHGRSITHVANLHDVPKLHVQRLVTALKAASALDDGSVSNHAKVQLLVKLRHILKPVHPAP